jgi:hypothetical protein
MENDSWDREKEKKKIKINNYIIWLTRRENEQRDLIY